MPTLKIPLIVTANELFEFPSDGFRYELIRGNLHMMSPAGGRHGRLAHRIAVLLDKHVEEFKLGVVFAAETGFRIAVDPDTVLAPDVAFLKQSRYDSLANETGYLPLAPDLAIEVRSPNDREARIEAKTFAWLDAGCPLVLIVDPEAETIQACRSREQIQVFESHESVDCSDAVSQWVLSVSEVFRR
ncbi:MAG: Uma2 family endonuclease [Pirellulaceae bacterium]